MWVEMCRAEGGKESVVGHQAAVLVIVIVELK